MRFVARWGDDVYKVLFGYSDRFGEAFCGADAGRDKHGIAVLNAFSDAFSGPNRSVVLVLPTYKSRLEVFREAVEISKKNDLNASITTRSARLIDFGSVVLFFSFSDGPRSIQGLDINAWYCDPGVFVGADFFHHLNHAVNRSIAKRERVVK
jgi:hypothetical protein